jgi:hypothetical protein
MNLTRLPQSACDVEADSDDWADEDGEEDGAYPESAA